MNIKERIPEHLTMLVAAVLVMGLIISWPVYASADSNHAGISGQSTDSPIKLTAQGASFSATVPTVLPYCAQTDGTVATAGCLKVINRSLGQIEVKKMVVELPEDWANSYADANGKGDKVIRLNIQGKDVPRTGVVNLEKFDVIDGGEALPICITACCDSDAMEGGVIEEAKLTIILGWNKIKTN